MRKVKPKNKPVKRHNRKNIDLKECIYKCPFGIVTPKNGLLCRIIGDYVDGYDYDCPQK